MCATIFAPHFAAKAKEKTPAAAAAATAARTRVGRAAFCILGVGEAFARRGVVLFSLSLLYSRQSFAEREREKLRASNQTDVMFEGENEGKNKYHIQTHISIEKEDGKGAATDG